MVFTLKANINFIKSFNYRITDMLWEAFSFEFWRILNENKKILWKISKNLSLLEIEKSWNDAINFSFFVELDKALCKEYVKSLSRMDVLMHVDPSQNYLLWKFYLILNSINSHNIIENLFPLIKVLSSMYPLK